MDCTSLSLYLLRFNQQPLFPSPELQCYQTGKKETYLVRNEGNRQPWRFGGGGYVTNLRPVWTSPDLSSKLTWRVELKARIHSLKIKNKQLLSYEVPPMSIKFKNCRNYYKKIFFMGKKIRTMLEIKPYPGTTIILEWILIFLKVMTQSLKIITFYPKNWGRNVCLKFAPPNKVTWVCGVKPLTKFTSFTHGEGN